MRPYLFAAATLLISINPVLAQDAANGEDVFKKCRTCHQVGDSAKNSVGPILNGIIGRSAGTIAGFSYSPANKEAGSKGLVWSEDNLFKPFYWKRLLAFVTIFVKMHALCLHESAPELGRSSGFVHRHHSTLGWSIAA